MDSKEYEDSSGAVATITATTVTIVFLLMLSIVVLTIVLLLRQKQAKGIQNNKFQAMHTTNQDAPKFTTAVDAESANKG